MSGWGADELQHLLTASENKVPPYSCTFPPNGWEKSRFPALPSLSIPICLYLLASLSFSSILFCFFFSYCLWGVCFSLCIHHPVLCKNILIKKNRQDSLSSKVFQTEASRGILVTEAKERNNFKRPWVGSNHQPFS